MPQNAFRYEALVSAEGKLDIAVPLPVGTKVEVLVLAPTVDEFQDLVAASQSSMEFWDNSVDDREWNNVRMREHMVFTPKGLHNIAQGRERSERTLG